MQRTTVFVFCVADVVVTVVKVAALDYRARGRVQFTRTSTTCFRVSARQCITISTHFFFAFFARVGFARSSCNTAICFTNRVAQGARIAILFVFTRVVIFYACAAAAVANNIK